MACGEVLLTNQHLRRSAGIDDSCSAGTGPLI